MSDLVKKADAVSKLETTLQAKTLKDLIEMKRSQRVSFLLLDYSSSMDGSTVRSARGYWDDDPPKGSGKRKIDALRAVVKDLENDGVVKKVGFGGYTHGGFGGVRFIDEIPEPEGGTPLAEGIEFAKQHGAQHLVVISDGAPDSQERALRAAQQFGGPIDVFYVGPPGDGGAVFLQKLADATQGQCQVTSLGKPVKELSAGIRGLLSGKK